MRGGKEIPTIVQRVEPIGTLRTPNIRLLDMRVEKTIRFPVGRLSLMANFSNMLNVNMATNVTAQSGASFNRPTAIVPPRVLELGATFRF